MPQSAALVATAGSDHRQIARTSPAIIDRPRLLSKLQGVFDHKLTLISAPPGYGKTTLVAQFVRQVSCPIAWHTIDERERDVPYLHNHCLTALAEIVPNINVLDTHQGFASSELAVLIADYLRETLKSDVIYILDDVQHLANAPPAEAWLRTLVTLMPPSCHLILVSRFLPNLPLAEFIARREVLAIGQEELRLNAEEVRELAALTNRSQLPGEALQFLLSHLEGWPAGTMLALQPLPPDFERALLNGQTGPEALFNALARPMLYSQPPDVRDFLLQSSTLMRMSPELCRKALGLERSPALLTEIQGRNLFLGSLPGGLVYHTLFRDLLQLELRSTDPDLFTALHSRAARFFEENDLIDEAFFHYAEAGDLPEASAIAQRVIPAYVAQGKVETLLAWNARLIQAGRPLPHLLLRCAIILTERYEYERALVSLDLAEAHFAQENDEEGLASVQLQRAWLNNQQGNFETAIELVEPLTHYPPGRDNLRGRALTTMGYATMMAGRAQEAATLLERALPLYRSYGDAYAQSHVLQITAQAYWRLGRLSEALAHTQEVVAFRRSLGGAEQLAAALNNLGYYYSQLGDYLHAASTIQEGLGALARSPSPRIETYLLENLADIQRNRGAFDEARALYHRTIELLGDGEPTHQANILANLATLYRWENKPGQAISPAERALDLAMRHAAYSSVNVATLALWMARACLGQADEALPKIQAVAEDFDARREENPLLRALGLCAHVALLAGQRSDAQHYLDRGLELALKIGTTQPLLCEVQFVPELEAVLRKSPARYARLLTDLQRLRQMQLAPATNALVSVQDPLPTFSLRIVTLGQEQISRDGIPVTSHEWRPAARQVFLYLMLFGAQDRAAISLRFWPDATYAAARRNFHNAIYYTRQALGDNVLSFHDERYQVAPDVDIWCDALELQRLTAQARLLSPHDARTEDLWSRAANLYNGEFLPGLESDWVREYRESLYEGYIEALTGIADCARARGDFRESIRRYKSVLSLDPYREEVHRAIMTCYAKRGTKKKVLTQMRDLQALLHNDLGVEPSADTWTHFRRLLA
ncbi:MAG TPA: tetratricopeptide repeat protein [Aggregatilineales bacterium]|nr:tetratricopeptide repeat protein [Aggregatilineales bacterium]